MKDFKSEDSWLVLLLLGVSMSASVFFYAMPGPVAENLGLIKDTEVLMAQVGRAADTPAAKRSNIDFEARFGAVDEVQVPQNGPGVFEGELYISVAEKVNEAGDEIVSAEHFYHIYDRVTGIVLELKPDGELPPGLENGAMLRARGNVSNGQMTIGAAVLPGEEGSVEVLAEGEALASPNTLNVGIILGNFTDKNVGCSAGQVENIMFNNADSVSNAFLSATNEAVGFSGDAYGPFDIPHSSSETGFNAWGTSLKDAATASGADLSQYDHLVYVVPSNATGYGGYAWYGGDAYIFYCSYPFIFEHELGHVLYIGHAGYGADEYGDDSSVMGNHYQLKHFNAPYVSAKNWIESTSVLNNPSSGSYILDSLDIAAAGVVNPQVLTFPKTDTSETYYVSYRTPDRYAANMPSQYQNMVSIHRWGGGYAATDLVKILSPGQAFADSANGLTVTFNGVVNNAADVTIATSAPSCDEQTPTVTVSPVNAGAVPGEAVMYSMNIKNNDGTYCSNKSFALSVTDTSADLSTSLSSNSVSLAPGGSSNVTVTAVSSDSIAGGTHTITLKAENGGFNDSATAQYTIDAVPPTAPQNVTVSVKRKQTNISWNSSSDNVAVAGYEVYRDSTFIGTTQNTTFADRAKNTGSSEYQVLAFDAAGNKSALSEIAVADSGGGDSGGDSGGKTTKCQPWPSCRNN